MPGRAPRRLPGVRFVAAPPPVDPLPRMDIAVLVGFAAEGPIDVPVAVESAAEFAAIFGEDAQVAWDPARGEAVYAHLGPAVRAFFRNGGLRCWVVRVAHLPRNEGDRGAIANVFPVTGLLRAVGDTLAPAVARARAEGSFSDDLRVSASLLARTVTLEALEKGFADAQQATATIATNAGSDLVPGDLLRFTFRDLGAGADADARLVWMLPVISLASADASDAGTLRPGQGRVFRAKARGDRSYWFRAGAPVPALAPMSLVADTFDGETTSASIAVDGAPSWKGGEVTLALAVPLAKAPAPGSFLRVDLGGEELWVRARDVRLLHAQQVIPTPKPETTQVTGPALRRLKAAPTSAVTDALVAAVAAKTTSVVVERLRMELWTRRGDAPVARLSDLGLGQRHPRFWGGLPTDDALYRARLESLAPGDDGVDSRPWAALWEAAATPRYTLAGDGHERPEADADRESFYLPIGMAFTADAFLGAVASADAALVRDGLETLGSGLFLDEKLVEATTTTLLAQADFIRYQSATPRALRGIHAALVVEEATLIAAPDAAHRHWSKTPPDRIIGDDEPHDGTGFGAARAEIAAPTLTIASAADRTGAFTIAWEGALATGERFLVQESRSPGFAPATTVLTGTAKQLAVQSRATGDWYYRARIEGASTLGPWSSALVVRVPEDFRDCRLPLGKPVLSLATGPDATGTFTLAWTGELDPGNDHVAGTRFVVEESPNERFDPTSSIYAGKEAQLTIWGRPQGDWHYRVRIENAAGAGPWSDALLVQVGSLVQSLLEGALGYSPNDLLDVQAALLRMSAARGDLLAVLGMPEHYREPEAVAHAAALSSKLGAGEAAALSYGALYHPWLLTRDEVEAAEIRRTPPDGAIAGFLARRALTRGAWIAPANEPLAAVVALTPIIGRDSRQALQDAQINLIRQEPGGFLVLDADTLSADVDLVPIHVRRMLSLLRRAALRLGSTYVFEPNDRSLRRLVQRGFEALLGLMFARGAFAGSNEASSFQVVPDDGPSTGAGAAEGRFSVDLRVAPAAPMTFLTVRLVQSGDRSRVTEVR